MKCGVPERRRGTVKSRGRLRLRCYRSHWCCRHAEALVDAVHDVDLQRVQVWQDLIALGTSMFGNVPLVLPVSSWRSNITTWMCWADIPGALNKAINPAFPARIHCTLHTEVICLRLWKEFKTAPLPTKDGPAPCGFPPTCLLCISFSDCLWPNKKKG